MKQAPSIEHEIDGVRRVTHVDGTKPTRVYTRHYVTGTPCTVAALLAVVSPSGYLPFSHVWFVANDGTAKQAKVNGKLRTWKRSPERVALPIKYGLYECFTFCEGDIDRILLDVEQSSVTDKR